MNCSWLGFSPCIGPAIWKIQGDGQEGGNKETWFYYCHAHMNKIAETRPDGWFKAELGEKTAELLSSLGKPSDDLGYLAEALERLDGKIAQVQELVTILLNENTRLKKENEQLRNLLGFGG